MSTHRRAVLTALALGFAVVFPAPGVLAQDRPTDSGGALDAAPNAPAPTDLWAEDAPASSSGALDAPLDAPAPTDAWAEDPAADAAPAIAPARPPGRRPSGIAEQLAGWVTATDDNGELPFLIVDKLGAHIFAFDAGGQFLGSAPVLVGLARGDDSAPGIGELKLSQISPDERTTPAGRFVARFGDSDGHGIMLWVDLRDAISLHPVMSVNPGEHRLQRIRSSDPDRHRISYGCINVPRAFYDDVVLTALAGGEAAVVYVLPDTKTIEEVFPAFAATVGGGEGEPPRQDVSKADPLAMPDPESARLDPVGGRHWTPPEP